MAQKKYLDNLIKLFISIIICEFAGIIGSFFTVPEIKTWFNDLNKPFFSPPNWIFGPVWTILYVLMGISLYLVWIKNWTPRKEIKIKKSWNKWSEKLLSGSLQKINIIAIFVVQLILNTLWSIIFFNAHSLSGAFFELIMLWFAIIFTIVNFYRVSKIAGILLIPYLLWVSFAGVLNYFLWIIN